MHKRYGGAPEESGSAVESRRSASELFTIKEVAEACGLPQPVVAQLVPRTWTDGGGMYTRAQLNLAMQTATDMTGPRKGVSAE